MLDLMILIFLPYLVIMLALLCYVLLCLLVSIVFLFIFYRERDLLGKRKCCKQAFSKVVLGVEGRESIP